MSMWVRSSTSSPAIGHGAVAGLAVAWPGHGGGHRGRRCEIPDLCSATPKTLLHNRNARSPFAQADGLAGWSSCWEGKVGHQWWLWVFLGEDTVVYRLDPSRSHNVPEGHFPDDLPVVVMVDRHASYKAMAQVKAGHVILAFCWAHVRRDFVKVGKGWDCSKPWALAWLKRIRTLYHHHRERRAHAVGSAAFAAADATLRETVATMKTRVEIELADPKLPTRPARVLVAFETWTGLTRFVDGLRIPLDNNTL